MRAPWHRMQTRSRRRADATPDTSDAGGAAVRCAHTFLTLAVLLLLCLRLLVFSAPRPLSSLPLSLCLSSLLPPPPSCSDSLFSCFDDCGVCVCSTICPCVQYGRNVRTLGSGDFCTHCCLYACCCPLGWICHMGQRTEMRNRYRLKVRTHTHKHARRDDREGNSIIDSLSLSTCHLQSLVLCKGDVAVSSKVCFAHACVYFCCMFSLSLSWLSLFPLCFCRRCASMTAARRFAALAAPTRSSPMRSRPAVPLRVRKTPCEHVFVFACFCLSVPFLSPARRERFSVAHILFVCVMSLCFLSAGSAPAGHDQQMA